jgi:hypothetical protein
MIDIVKALQSLRPNAEWNLRGTSYANLEWVDKSQTKPTEAEVEAEIVRLQSEYERNEYQRQRAEAYPSFAEQFDLLYHGGYDAWKAAIDAVKQEFPKP